MADKKVKPAHLDDVQKTEQKMRELKNEPLSSHRFTPESFPNVFRSTRVRKK